MKRKPLGYQLSGALLNSPGNPTKYGTELGNYVHKEGFDDSNGICVKLNANGSWNEVSCPGPTYEKLIDTGILLIICAIYRHEI